MSFTRTADTAQWHLRIVLHQDLEPIKADQVGEDAAAQDMDMVRCPSAREFLTAKVFYAPNRSTAHIALNSVQGRSWEAQCGGDL
ncbi:MAG TPA: hypothetical protein VLX29_11715 [Nitrospirota bacterium]|nr:hypothetical protein [Nitrospirota bacterium]